MVNWDRDVGISGWTVNADFWGKSSKALSTLSQKGETVAQK